MGRKANRKECRPIIGLLSWFFPTVFLLMLSAIRAQADEVFPGIRYSCENGYFVIHPAYTVNPSTRPVAKLGFWPHVYDPDLNLPRTISRCLIEDAEFELTQDFQNTPRPSGICGGATWSTYRLQRNGQDAVFFQIGCNDDVHIVANQWGINVCVSFMIDCKSGRWGDPFLPIRGR